MAHDANLKEEHLELLHQKITSALAEVLERNNPFQFQKDRLTFNCLNIAHQVFQTFSPKIQFTNLLKGDKDNFEIFGAHPVDDKLLENSIQNIWKILLTHLEEIPLEKLLKSSVDIGIKPRNVFSFYPEKSPFIKDQIGCLQPVSTGENATGTKKMRAHLCRINLTTDGKVFENIKQAILRQHKNAYNWEDIQEEVESLFSLKKEPTFSGLQKLIDEESLGLIKREAEISYLEYLLKNAQPTESEVLAQFTKNIRFIEHYINADEREDKDCLYQITHEHHCDLRDLLDVADAFATLPIIGKIDGNIEERTSPSGDRTFVFGMRFKANGIVTSPEPGFKTLTTNETVYTYHLKKSIEILEIAKSYNTEPKLNEEDYPKLKLIGQAIRTVFVYFMVFSKKTDKVQEWQTLAEKLHDARANNALSDILMLANKMLNAKEKIENDIKKVRDALEGVLNSQKKCQYGNFDRYLLLSKGLLNNASKAANGYIFIDDLSQHDANKGNLKKCLRYMRVTQQTDDLALHAIRFNFSFRDIFFYASKLNRQKILMSTQPENFKFLPIVIASENLNKPPETATVHIIVDRYSLEEGDEQKRSQTAICSIATAVVLHLVLAILCFKLSKYGELAVPILRIHSGHDDKTEEYFNAVCKAITFLLSEKYQIGLQGLQYLELSENKEKNLEHRIHNARSSLYSFLPKYFTCEQVIPSFQKFAIVVLSTRRAETQAATQMTPKQDNWLNLTVRIMLFEQLDTHQTKLSSYFRTFSENCTDTAPNEGTPQLIDAVRDLYEKHGVKNVLYISKAPFTNNLHLTQSNSALTLYFSSETILKKMREGYPDFNIYPVFFDNYPAKLLGGEKLNALYIDDVSAIQKQVQMDQEKSSRIITFLNIANGMVVGKKQHIFNNIMTYATLDNIYTDTTLNIDILSQQILNDSPIRKTLIYFICLLHMAAFEKVDGGQEKFKLNPYKDIFSDENVNAINTFSIFGQGKRPRFNLFALLTKVQRVMRLLESRQTP